MGLTEDPQEARESHVDPMTGMQEKYVVLSDEERAKGFVRPYRDTYVHVGRRPEHPTRDLTDEEKERHAGQGYVLFETYPESESPRVGRFWNVMDLNSGCGQETWMAAPIAETYARDPGFYGGTYCGACRGHFPVGPNGEFVWKGTDIRVGT